MPAAVVENGTRPGQRVFSATIETLPAMVAKADLKGPSLIIIGGVVGLRDGLNWYAGDRPQDGAGEFRRGVAGVGTARGGP
jgi:uroporphyrin-III C-methyltransferase/precorrin-2 dehydrogenase/sirohydrochlorin ferrochelatase